MDNICTLIERHCHNLLDGYGWPREMEIAFSLGCSQGDGVAFYGTVSEASLIHILEQHVARGELSQETCATWAEQIKDCQPELRLVRNAFGHRYAHANCIRCDWHCVDDESEALAESLELLILRDIDVLCAKMEYDGYRLQEAMLPSDSPLIFQRKTANFAVQVEEVDSNEWGLDDDEYRDEIIHLILTKGASYRPLTVRIINLATDTVMGLAWTGDVLRLPDQPARSWFDRYWLKEAMNDARQNIAELMASFSTFSASH